MKKISVCLGVGMGQIFPEYIEIEIPEDDEVSNEDIKIEVDKPKKKRGRKKKTEE